MSETLPIIDLSLFRDPAADREVFLGRPAGRRP
jgi:hypothetical protein